MNYAYIDFKKLCFKLIIIIYPGDFQILIRFIRSYVQIFQRIDPYNYLVRVRQRNFIYRRKTKMIMMIEKLLSLDTSKVGGKIILSKLYI